MDNIVVEEIDDVTVQDLETSDVLAAGISSFEAELHDLDQRVPQSIQETDSPDLSLSNSTAQQEIENAEFLCSLNDNTWTNVDDDTLLDTIELNKSVLDISPQETQVFAINRSNVEDNLLTVDNTEADKLLCVPQDELPCSSSDQPPGGGSSSSTDNNLTVTEKPSSPTVVSCKQQDSPSPPDLPCPQELPSPQKSSSPQRLLAPEKSPSPQRSSLVNTMSLSPCDLGTPLLVCKTVSRVQLVDYDYDADSDSGDDDANENNVLGGVTMEIKKPVADSDNGDDDANENNVLGGITMEIKKPVVDHKYTDDSTDTISDDSDSNSLVDKSHSTKFTSTADSNYLAHDLSDTGTISSDEKMECTDVSSLETTVVLSPPLPFMKIVAQKSNVAPVSPISNEGDMDVNTSAEDEATVHTVETSQSVSTISTITTPPISVEVSPSISNASTPHVSTLAAPPLFDITTQPVYPVSSADTTILTTTASGNLSSVFDKDTICNENPWSSLMSTTTSSTYLKFPSFYEDTFVYNKGTPVTSKKLHACAAGGSEFKDGVQSLANFATDFAQPSLDMVQKAVSYSAPPVSTAACNELPVSVIPGSVLNTCSPSISELHTSDPIQSTSFPFLSSRVCNPSVKDSLAVTTTRASSQTSTVEVSNENNTTNASTVSSNSNGDHVTDPTQSLGSCQVVRKDISVPDPDNTNDDTINDDGEKLVSTFPDALKLSIELSVLPQKRKVLQRAKWATLLTTSVPVLRERRRPVKSTVTIKSTVIKSDRKPTTNSPKKQLSESGNQHQVGEVLWSKFSYWDPWPCQIILHSDVDQPEPPPDQVNNPIGTHQLVCLYYTM